MINLFPTWHVWRLIHTYPTREIDLLMRILRVDPYKLKLATMHNVWMWLFVNLVVIGLTCSNLLDYHLSISSILWVNSLILFLFITIDSLHYALKIMNSISKWRQLGNDNIFMLLPAGELESFLNICRTHRFPLDSTIRNIKPLLVLVILGVSSAVAFTISLGNAGFFIMLMLWILVAGLFYCVDYVQSFVSATLISLLVSQHQNHSEHIRMIGAYLGLQIALYIVFLPLLINLIPIWQENEIFSRRIDELNLWWLVVFAPLIFVVSRELINLVLWQAVKRRLEA